MFWLILVALSPVGTGSAVPPPAVLERPMDLASCEAQAAMLNEAMRDPVRDGVSLALCLSDAQMGRNPPDRPVRWASR
ncbi:hypothetical protein [Sabulicella glaciei]|uniref:Uncharacterized protein n=1 Tax=Sabulicella glaciei TaxID=2984948 RepID=A0ABT3NY59_9PROT|nr:hypothetical protein [Roseococcus sp. MDT2-1-1]MCW8087101.1 hypothetical protein [Roseococcus sp. MDT2-1-1]